MYGIDCNNIGRVLRDDWVHNASPRRSRHTLARWGETEPALVGLESLAAVVAAIEGAPLPRSIEVTQAVLRLAATEEMARRLFIQVMVPTIASESYRSLRVLQQIHRHDHTTIRPTGADVVDLVLAAATEAVACYGGRTLAYPLRTIRRRFIEIIIHRRSKLITAEINAVSLSSMQPNETFARRQRSDSRRDAGTDPGEACLPEPQLEPSAAEVLAETLDTAVELGIVSEGDADLVWATRYHQQTSLDLGDGDMREAERLRRRRSRAQQRLIAARDELVASGVAA